MIKTAIISLILIFGIINLSFADSIYLKSKEEELKGLVVDDFTDRIVLSTADGEITIMKSDIKDIKYDTIEQNYFQLGREYEKRKRYKEAITYYEKALKENPNYTEAKNALVLMRVSDWKKEQDQIKTEMQRKMALLNYKESGSSGVVRQQIQDKDKLLKRKFGISLDESDGWPRIANIVNFEITDRLKKGDLIVAIWGKQTRFIKIDNIVDELLASNFREVSTIIERKITISSPAYPNSLKEYGFSVSMEMDGLTVKTVLEGSIAEKIGLQTSDLIVSIKDQPTRYMPLNNTIKLIESSKEPIGLVIRRTVFLPRRD